MLVDRGVMTGGNIDNTKLVGLAGSMFYFLLFICEVVAYKQSVGSLSFFFRFLFYFIA